MKKLKFQNFNIDIKAINDEENIIEGVFSTGMTDRQGEIVDQSGWQLSEFLLNPVVLFAHDQYIPAIGKVIELGIDQAGNLAGKIKFAVEENPLAKTIFGLYKGGFMKAFSVGFECLDVEVDMELEQVVLRKNILYELSCVNVPANSLALAKSKGLDISGVEDYIAKEEKSLEVQKANLEKLKSYEEKEGRVLSKKNREVIETAKKALENVLSADQPTDDDKSVISSDTKEKEETTVETPLAPVGGKKGISNRKINKAIRELLSKKKLSKV